MLGKIARTLDALQSYGCKLESKAPGNIVLTYKDHKINVLPSGSIYLDGNTSAFLPYRTFGTMAKFEKLFN
jgi:hypothetical protein